MATKASWTAKLKWAGWALKFAKHFPKLALFSALSAISYFGYSYLETAKQKNQLILEQVQQLSTQNKALADANQAITQDMQVIKQGMEQYSRTLADIRKATQSLDREFKSEKFRELLKKDLPKAEKEFNQFFNEYFQDIEKDTRNAK